MICEHGQPLATCRAPEHEGNRIAERNAMEQRAIAEDQRDHPRRSFRDDFVPAGNAGMVGHNVVGVGPDGKVPDGAVDAFYREPQRDRDEHHTDGIVLNGVLHFQQSPPVHVNGSQPKRPPPGRSKRRAIRDLAALIADADCTGRQREVWALRYVGGHSPGEIARLLGLSPTQVERDITAATKAARAAARE